MKSMVWGTIIILIGISVLLGAIFGINVPILKILFGMFLLYLGLKVIFGSFSWNFEVEKRSSDHEAVFSKSQFQYPNSKQSKEYVTVFGSSELDLSKADTLSELESVTVFGESTIYVKKGQALKVESNTVMGKSELPGKNISAMGKFQYQTPDLKSDDKVLNLTLTVVFGSLRVVEVE